jgi:hypothetical protein
MCDVSKVFDIWRASLSRLLAYYVERRGRMVVFLPVLFLVFVLVNVICFWWALLTAFSFLTHGSGTYYLKLQVPVGALGACFDTVSFFVTIFIVRRAIRTRSNLEYLAHLSIDLVIAVAATCWVLFVFSISGWLIRSMEEAVAAERTPIEAAVVSSESGPKAQETRPRVTKAAPSVAPRARTPRRTAKPPEEQVSTEESEPRTFGGRAGAYQDMLVDAIGNPTQNLRYIYFGAIMGASASLPTCVHIYMFFASLARFIFRSDSETDCS